MAVNMKTAISWDVMPSRLVGYQHFRGSCYFHPQDRRERSGVFTSVVSGSDPLVIWSKGNNVSTLKMTYISIRLLR
jgi:hypothetical protein